MQVGPGYPARHAHFAQRGSRGHVLSGRHIDLAQVAIHADHAAAVIHKHRNDVEKIIYKRKKNLKSEQKKRKR